MAERRNVVIIGGGLTGLSAAFYTRNFLREAGFEPNVTVLEKGNAWGGKIETLHKEGFVIEKGFQNGGQKIRDMGVRLESLAIVDSMTDDSLTFRE